MNNLLESRPPKLTICVLGGTGRERGERVWYDARDPRSAAQLLQRGSSTLVDLDAEYGSVADHENAPMRQMRLKSEASHRLYSDALRYARLSAGGD